MPRKADMRITQSRLRRQWRRLAALWLELLWSCPCTYNNIATYRCYGCGSPPPREVRDLLATTPMPEPLLAAVGRPGRLARETRTAEPSPSRG